VTNHHTPLPVSGDVVFDGVTAHAPSHTCALTGTGAAHCWGSNQFGQLGDGTTGSSTVPVPVSGDIGFTTVSTGFAHTCGVTSAGAAYCWGNGQVGQLGTGLLEDTSEPVRVIAQMP
jgi:alpha-tubulin suppressor-like RCC1 family protein